MPQPAATTSNLPSKPPLERPNTIAGLQAKRKELVKLRAALEADVRKVTCDLDHIDACIRLFDPEADVRAVKRYATKHRAKRGQMRRFVLDQLKAAAGPITSRDIAEAWVQDRGLRADDGTLVMVRKRVGACLIALRGSGLIHQSSSVSEYKVWNLNA